MAPTRRVRDGPRCCTPGRGIPSCPRVRPPPREPLLQRKAWWADCIPCRPLTAAGVALLCRDYLGGAGSFEMEGGSAGRDYHEVQTSGMEGVLSTPPDERHEPPLTHAAPGVIG